MARLDHCLFVDSEPVSTASVDMASEVMKNALVACVHVMGTRFVTESCAYNVSVVYALSKMRQCRRHALDSGALDKDMEIRECKLQEACAY